MVVENLLDTVAKDVPKREKQIELLIRLLDEDAPSAAVCAVGPGSSGKTLTVRTLLQKAGLHHAWVSCAEVYHLPLLLESVIGQLTGETDTRCEDLPSFVSALSGHLHTSSHSPSYIILDEVEQLLKLEPHVVTVFLQLRDLCLCDNISVVFITELPWEKFLPRLPLPLFVPFPAYSREELEEVLRSYCPPESSEQVYANYIRLVLGVFLPVTRDLAELRHLASLHFDSYCEPIHQDGVDPDNVHQLYRHMEPILRKAVHTVYLREVSSGATAPQCRATVELPFYSKFLLLAAYLASYNPARTDAKFFLKDRYRRRKSVKKGNEANLHMLGPQQFTLSRLQAVLAAIVGEPLPGLAALHSQLASLVALRLVARCSQDWQLGDPRYKCLAELGLVVQVARTVNFDLMVHLNDYN